MTANKATAEQITFYSYWLPTLAPGQYSVTANTEMTVPEEPSHPTRDVTETFHVGGPRYALSASEGYSCYPAPGQIGKFYDTLPHIVFDRCTLPWERTIDGSDPTVKPDGKDPCPWLSLILLTDADFASDGKSKGVPPIVPRTLAEVYRPPENNVIGPELVLDPYDSDSDPCQTIDLPASVFRDVMPKKKDLPFLAHVREVETDNKETWSLLKEGKFSVVICNRFPETQAPAAASDKPEKDWGIVNTVCIVSLEGWQKHLNSRRHRPDPEPEMTYRLLVLGYWRFTCQGSSAFKSQMEHLDDQCLLRRPLIESRGTIRRKRKGEEEAINPINNAFALGFAPVNHDLRNDDTTISWYRGPLVPMLYQKAQIYSDISCADAALQYNPETGMFDASHAAAWQLGRLLALQDQSFAQSLFRFRTDYQRWVRSTNTEALEKLHGKKKANDLKKTLGGISNIRNWYSKQLTGAKYLNIGPAAVSDQTIDPPAIPTTVQNWIGQAMLLYGVPFHYLVPDEAMLPPESIRFFYLNPEWINCLLQGACSVGRTSTTDELADQLLRARFFEVSEKLAAELRTSAKQAADRRRSPAEGQDQGTSTPAPRTGWEPSDAVLKWPLSGYLLRSTAVESWIGLEAKAKGVDSTGKVLDPIQILRMDRLAPDILLCIFNGKVTEIEIKQPPEAIHFGAASKAEGGHEKTGLRKITGKPQTMRDKCEGHNIVDVPMSEKRVVDVNTLATNFKTKLTDIAQLSGGDSFTSAEFAVEMIESPAKVTFRAPEELDL